MAAVESYNATTTAVEFSAWPQGITGLERIMLMACGDLQRLLSTFFAEAIIVKAIYAHTSPRLSPASLLQPVTQKREVHLKCIGKTVCIATSFVTITGTQCERLFLDERHAIGQMFRKMNVVPAFDLLGVGTGLDEATGKHTLWRRYTLSMDGFECEIFELFPDRDMFVRGVDWLLDTPVEGDGDQGEYLS